MKKQQDLPDALTAMHDAIDELCQPQTRYIEGRKRYAPSLYRQLQSAVSEGLQAGTAPHTGSAAPLWISAEMLLQEIDIATEAWNPQPAGIPPAVGRLHALEARPWAPESIHSVKQITAAVLYWVRRIQTLLDPVSAKSISEPCPHCAQTTVRRPDDSGEYVRQAALQIITNYGATCLACDAYWPPENYPLLAMLLGLELPDALKCAAELTTSGNEAHTAHAGFARKKTGAA